MITVNMVPADVLINKVADYIKNNVREVKPPEWSYFAKTASFKERLPDDVENWWYIRTASLMRKLYLNGPFGLSKAQVIYGGLKRRGTRPPRTVRAPTHSARLILQQLEKAGLVVKTKEGRALSPRGRSLLDKLAYEIFIDLADKNPSLKKYLE
ncbi:MAG: 30S ribosomal protein S19e [Candidatus Aramenus sp.]|nr:30S ribosomal protein S19e [Candidatus Aramenus sp.]